MSEMNENQAAKRAEEIRTMLDEPGKWTIVLSEDGRWPYVLHRGGMSLREFNGAFRAMLTVDSTSKGCSKIELDNGVGETPQQAVDNQFDILADHLHNYIEKLNAVVKRYADGES